MSKEAIILKSDAGGRVLVPVERQVELVREFERSGLSGRRFAEIAGVKYHTFAASRRKTRDLEAKIEAEEPIVAQLSGALQVARQQYADLKHKLDQFLVE